MSHLQAWHVKRAELEMRAVKQLTARAVLRVRTFWRQHINTRQRSTARRMRERRQRQKWAARCETAQRLHAA